MIDRNGFRRLRAQGGARTGHGDSKAANGEATNYSNRNNATRQSAANA